MVHGIVEDHGGIITVESELNIGTTFRIHLPVAPTPAAAASPQPFPPPRGSGQRVLFIDDEPDVVAVGARVLTRLGYQPMIFTRPADALAAFNREPMSFDAVITDLTMPGISGADLIAEIRALRPGLPVLAMTGYLRAAEQERIRALGVTQFLEKPFTLASLADAMHLLLART